jgi:hypothetical protein
MVPSIAVTNRPRQYTPFVAELAAGPRSRSNRARSGATPIRRRGWASAEAVGVATVNPSSPEIIFAHTWPYPSSANTPSGQQQVDHDPRGQVPHPCLDLAGLGQRGVDHLERHDLRQLAQMTRGEPA